MGFGEALNRVLWGGVLGGGVSKGLEGTFKRSSEKKTKGTPHVPGGVRRPVPGQRDQDGGGGLG